MGVYSNTVSGAYADKIKAVYEHLYEIKKVADRLTPVEDLESFQSQIEDIHANLDVMVEASNLLVTATEVGETVLTASSWQALKVLLGVDQLHPDSVTVAMLNTALAALQQTIQDQIDALSIPSLDGIHTSLSGLQGSINTITADMSAIQGSLSVQQGLVSGLQTSYTDLLNGISSNQTNITAAISRLTVVEGLQIIQDSNYTTLAQNYTNLQAGLTATNTSVSGQAASITVLEGQTQLNNSAITQLTSELLNTNTNLSGHSDALDTISTTLTGIGNDLIAQANRTTALKSAIGGSGNLLPNADFAVMADGWVKTVGQGDWAATVLAVNDFVRPSGVNSLDLTGAPSPSGQIVVESPPVLVSGDGFYAISGYPCASNGVATLGWRAYNSSGGLMAQGMCPPASNPVNNSDLSAYTRVWHNFQVYPGTTHIKLYFSVMADGDGVSLGSLFRPMVEKSWADQVGPSAWTPNLAGVSDAMSTALNELSTEVSQIGDAVTAVSESNLALQSQITTAEGTLVSQGTAISTMGTRVTATEGAITALGNRTTTIEGRMSGTSGALATQAQVSTAEAASVSRDNALGSRIDTTDAVVAGKASSGTVNVLSSRVDVTEAGIAAQGLALTGVKAQLGGIGANLVVNSCGEADLAGWILTGTGGAHSQMSLGRNYAAPYTLPPGTMYVAQAGVSVDGYSDAQYHDTRMVVEPGKRYCVQVLAMAHRTTGTLFFKWNAVNGSIIGGWLSADIATSSPPVTAGDRLELFQRVSLFAVAPVGAATVSIMIRKYGSTGAPNNDSYLFFTRLAVNEVPADLTTPPPWAPTATGLDSKYAAVTQSMQAEVTSVGNVAKASHTVTLDVNGNISGTRSENTGTSSSFSVLASIWRVISSGTTGLEWRDGYLRAYSGAIQLVLGINFGASSNLCFWYGPNVGAAGCTKTNGTIWFDNGGDAYFGGSLSAGILKNAAQSTQASKTATVSTGTFASNGGARLVVGSFSFNHVGFVSGNVGGSSGSIVLTVRRSSTVVATVTISGGYTANYDSELNTTRMVANFSGSVTHTDNTGGNSVEYSSTLSGATGSWPMSLYTNSSGTGPLSTPVWRTGIISTEE